MAEAPVDRASIEDLARLAAALMRAGAPIEELNAVRGALSRLKAGGLARALGERALVCVVVSDVPGLRPELVGSGPCAAMPEVARAARVVRARGCEQIAGDAVMRALEAARDEPCPRVQHVVAADGAMAARAMVAAARARGIELASWPGLLCGEAREAGAAIARHAAAVARGAAGVIAHGETVVTVRGRGRGGRNQELALGWLLSGGVGTLGALATDGVDGATDACGAIVDATTLERARAAGADGAACLAENDSHRFFAATGDTIVSGPTGTNVADVVVWIDDARLPDAAVPA